MVEKAKNVLNTLLNVYDAAFFAEIVFKKNYFCKKTLS